MSLVERDVQAAFVQWLDATGWTITTAPHDRWIDVYAVRDEQILIAEVKGRTSSPGLDIDTAYGQLLRRVPDDVEHVRLALVVPDWPPAVRAALRVPAAVRDRLGIDVYVVSQDGTVAGAPRRRS